MNLTIKNHVLMDGTTPINFIKSPHTGGALKSVFLVIHYTASGPSSDIGKYFSNPSAGVSAHIVVRRDGTITQCVAFNKVAFHAGQSSWIGQSGKSYVGLNKHAVGIEIENWGPLKRNGSGWVSWTGQPVDSGLVIEAKHKFGTPNCGWEIYTEAQITSCIELAKAICSAYNITEIVGHDDISPGRKSDPGPAWNMRSFVAKVFGRASNEGDFFTVRSPTGLNIRTRPGIDGALLRPEPLPDGTRVRVLAAEDQWRLVTVLNDDNKLDFSGWVHGAFLHE